jgi:UDP-3-O-[3-hydroxymyristoyl] glucosamine N-acyltransferase
LGATILHPNVSIGADGFGFRPSPDGKGLIKIPHIGNVVIGNGVRLVTTVVLTVADSAVPL